MLNCCWIWILIFSCEGAGSQQTLGRIVLTGWRNLTKCCWTYARGADNHLPVRLIQLIPPLTLQPPVRAFCNIIGVNLKVYSALYTIWRVEEPVCVTEKTLSPADQLPGNNRCRGKYTLIKSQKVTSCFCGKISKGKSIDFDVLAMWCSCSLFIFFYNLW